MTAKAFDIAEGIFFFFKRVGEKPMAALWIAVWHLVLLSAVAAAAFWLFMPFFNEVVTLSPGNIHMDDDEVLQALGRVLISMPLILLAGIAVSLMVHSAWMRFLARGEVPAGIPVRLGGDELRLLGVMLLFFGILIIAEIAASAVFAVIGLSSVGLFALADGHHSVLVTGGIAFGLIGLAYLAAQIFVSVRLSPAAGLSFVDRKFRFFEAWDASRGQFWKMLVSYVAVAVLIYVLFIAVAIVFGLMLAGTLLPVIADLEAISDMNGAPAEVLAALREVFLRPGVMIPLGILVALGAMVEIAITGMWMGVGVYAARLYRDNHPVEGGDAPILAEDHPAGASPAEG